MSSDPQTTHLRVVAERNSDVSAPSADSPSSSSLQQQVLARLSGEAVLTRDKLRQMLSVKNERLGKALLSLEQDGRIGRTSAGWRRMD